MIEWTDDALNRDLDAWWRSGRCERRDMRAALDAAVEAQGSAAYDFIKAAVDALCAQSIAQIRAEALEEAARVAEVCHFDEDDPRNDDRDRAYAQARRHAAKDIRALKEAK